MRNVIVIGAGPAGSIAAMVLARAGVHVTLVEQHRFPRDKVCGECLSALAIEILEKLDLASRLRDLGPSVIRETSIYSILGSRYCLRLPRPMWGISRSKLDEFLLNEANVSGVKVLQPARCEAVESKPLGVRVRDLQNNTIVSLNADCIVIADGKGALNAPTFPPTGDFGIKAHFENVDAPRQAIGLFGGIGVYGGLSAIEDGLWNTAFSVPANRLREFGGDIEKVFQEIRSENPSLDHQFRDARRTTQWLAAPLPRFCPRGDWPAGVIPIGNAAAALEPVGGEGMGLAIASAHLAATELCRIWKAGSVNSLDYFTNRGGEAPADPGRMSLNLFQEYQRLWRVRSASCRFAAQVISSPTASRLLLPLLKIIPLTQRMSMSLLGKNHLNPSISDIV